MPAPRTRPRPTLVVDPTEAFYAAHYLDQALDALLDARHSLGGDPTVWSPPTSALSIATDSDAEHRRHSARVREVVDRLRGLAPLLEPDLVELHLACGDLAGRASEVGFALGVSLARPTETSPDVVGADANREE